MNLIHQLDLFPADFVCGCGLSGGQNPGFHIGKQQANEDPMQRFFFVFHASNALLLDVFVLQVFQDFDKKKSKW